MPRGYPASVHWVVSPAACRRPSFSSSVARAVLVVSDFDSSSITPQPLLTLFLVLCFLIRLEVPQGQVPQAVPKCLMNEQLEEIFFSEGLCGDQVLSFSSQG